MLFDAPIKCSSPLLYFLFNCVDSCPLITAAPAVLLSILTVRCCLMHHSSCCDPHRAPAEEMPDLHQWMIDNSVISASFASEWFLTLFSAHSADAAVRIWDVFLLEGTSFLYKVAAGA
jgi:hypothetical protein